MAEDVRKAADTAGLPEFEKQYTAPHCVVLDSEYCSMGRMIGVRACRLSGYTYYDAVILLELVPDSGVSIEEVEAFEQKLRPALLTKEEITAMPEWQRIASAFDRAADIALAKGPCLIHDRMAKEMIEAKGYSCTSVLMYATDAGAKIVRAKVSPLYSSLSDPDVIAEKIREEDNIRINTRTAQSDHVWGRKENYDLCINSETFGRDYAAAILAGVMKGE